MAAASHCRDTPLCLMITSGGTVYPWPPSMTLIRSIRVVGFITACILAGLYSSPNGAGGSTLINCTSFFENPPPCRLDRRKKSLADALSSSSSDISTSSTVAIVPLSTSPNNPLISCTGCSSGFDINENKIANCCFSSMDVYRALRRANRFNIPFLANSVASFSAFLNLRLATAEVFDWDVFLLLSPILAKIVLNRGMSFSAPWLDLAGAPAAIPALAAATLA
mmetsp:Transcript_5479/g.12499  ORF Transcript_5479/g.12499 Transcript_5479/m.12499 type:complete len:223 (-) Transcript_5479:967-1635(-)